MSAVHICPCCQVGELMLEPPERDGGPYRVTCYYCGTRFDHDMLRQGFNGAMRFVTDIEWVDPDGR